MRFRKDILGWCMFDFANSSYTTVIISVFFAVIFTQLIVGPDKEFARPDTVAIGDKVYVDGYGIGIVGAIINKNSVVVNIDDKQYTFQKRDLKYITYRYGNYLWSLALVLSYIIVAAASPFLGAISDRVGRKRMLFFSYLVTIVFSAVLYFPGAAKINIYPGYINVNRDMGSILIAIVGIIVSNIGYSFGENFSSSLLADLGDKRDYGKISGYAWAIGYFGGLLSIAIVYYFTGARYELSNYENLRLIGPFIAVFFGVFAIPTFLFVREKKSYIKSNRSSGLKKVLSIVRDYREHRDILIFLLAFFFIYSGISIAITFSAIYGSQYVNLTLGYQAIFFVVIQLSAAIGAFVFGYIEDKIGAKKTIIITLFIWIAGTIAMFFVKEIANTLNQYLSLSLDVQVYFIIIGNVMGLCLGATQSSVRAYIAIYSSYDRVGEFYGLWGLAGKLASAFAIIVYGQIQYIMGVRYATLFCVVFFVLGLVVLYRVRGTQTSN